ncbi:MAG TPA: S8 family serine peptidase [Thermoanaerobaculia bacterium]|nr:S8 family serine peptidase [Thermoanaerobaculia bacterium]
MKRTTLAIFSLLLTVAAFGAETERYLVATKRGAHADIVAHAKQLFGETMEERAVATLQTFAGFAASLTEEEAAALSRSPDVRWVERVVPRHKSAQNRHPFKQATPLGMNAIFAREAQRGAPRGTVNVVVIDTGIDYRHPDLQAAYMGGWNVLKDNNDPLDDDGHGTHVAGTIAATDNAIGVVGVAPKVKLWSVKMLDGQGNGDSEGMVKALDWVVAQKAALGGNWIINLSLGATQESGGEYEAFQSVTDQGILVVAASGNLSTPNVPAPVVYPAAYPNVIAVSATTFDKAHASFSGQGPEVDLAAPGVNVLSTVPVGTFDVSYVVDGNSATFVNEVNGSKRGVVSAEFVYCGTGKIGDFPPTVAGKIALVQRGDKVSFSEKARRAKEAGAIAVAIFDNEPVPSPGSWTLLNNDEDRLYDWPVTLRLTQQTGQALLALGSHPITVAYTTDDYHENSGTSMACPHVVGAAALVWALAPDATAAQITSALKTTATDLGAPGPDSLFGAGFVNANAAGRLLAPGAFPSITTGRPLGLRGRR